MEEKYPAGKMSIYFGSQTGTAMGFAKILATTFAKKSFEVKVVDLEDFSADQLLQSRIAIFLVATYGEGNPTDNALGFYEWLCNSDGQLPSTYLSSVSFAVFGLGNSTYVNYNQMGKSCNEMLERLGGKRVHPLACGDDSCTLEEDFESWKAAIVEDLLKKYLTKEKPVETTCNRPRVALTFTTNPVPQSEAVIPPPSEMNTTTKYFFSSPQSCLSAVRDLKTAPSPVRTLHLEFDISNSELQYNAADNLAVIPENDPAAVGAFARSCGEYDLAQYVKLVPAPQDTDVEMPTAGVFRFPFPSPCSIGTIFTKYLDLFAIPRRSTLERFGPYVTDQDQFMWLEAITAKDSRDDYSTLIENEGKTYASLLMKELSSCVIPLDHLLHLVPFIQPRFYTISSSSSLFPQSIHLTVTKLHRKSPSGCDIYGLCTSYLSSLSLGAPSRVFIRESLFKLPPSVLTPIILIGTGSGIAPLRALLQEREYQAKQQNVPLEQMTNILFFGCRSKQVDFLYGEEFTAALDRRALTSLKLALSQEDGQEKVYVQDLIKRDENKSEVFRLFDSGAHVFICGGTMMGSAVAESFATIVAEEKKVPMEEARESIKEAQSSRRYKQELWSV